MPAEPQAVTPSMKASAFQAEAMKLIEEREKAAPVTPAPPAPAAAATPPPAPQVDPSAPPAQTETPPPAETPPTQVEPPKGFDVLAREKAALRKREQEINDRAAKHARVIEVLERGGSTLEILAAAGRSYQDATQEVLTGKKPAAAPAAGARPADDPLVQQVNKLTEMLTQEREQRARAEAVTKVTAAAQANPDKYKLVNARGAAPQAAQMLADYFTQVGELPVPGNFDASLGVALEHLETNLAKEADAWAGVLQKSGYTVTKSGVAPKTAVTPPASAQGTQSRTLNNGQAAPVIRTPPAEPKTEAEFRAAALREFNRLAAASG